MSGVFSFEGIYEQYVEFDPRLPPIFDEYGDKEAVISGFKAPCDSFGCGYAFDLIPKVYKGTIGSIKFQDQSECYLVDFEIEKDAATVKDSSYLHYLFKDEIYSKLSRLVHGGRRGGRHKMVFGILFVYVHGVFIFDPGGVRLYELRTIPFEGGGDDTGEDTVDITHGSLGHNLMLTVGSSSSRACFVCLISCIGYV